MALLSYPNGSIEPVAVADARVACRIDGLDLDGELAGLISAAREQAEQITGRDYAKHGLYYYDDEWSGGLTSRTMHSKGLYQWLDGQGINESLILEHLRSV